MKKKQYILLFASLLLSLSALAQYEFIENKGQWDGRALFRARVPAGYLNIEQTGFNWYFYDDAAYGRITARDHHHNFNGDTSDVVFRWHVLMLDFVDMNPMATAEKSAPSPTLYNYFLGNDPAHWAGGVHSYFRITRKNVWNGIDLKLYNSSAGLKYDIVLKPGADLSAIKMKYRGQEAMVVADGKLSIKTSVNELHEEIPEAYQYIGDKKVPVKCRYVQNGDVISFAVDGYDPTRELVIDPVIFVTYSGSTADNFGFTATYDSRGNMYIGGNVTSAYVVLPNGKYPTTPGAFEQTFRGGTNAAGPPPYKKFPCDMAISKYDSAGHNLIFATYLGGTNNDYPHSLVVDHKDRLMVLGSTYSKDFPIVKTCFDTTKNGAQLNSDIVIVKFDSSGTALLASTYVGGSHDDGIDSAVDLVYNYADDFRGDIIVDLQDNVYVASCSASPDFPVQDPSQGTKGASVDGVVFCLDSSLSNMLWSTFLGGNNDDALYSIRLDDDDNVLVAGGTKSTNLPAHATALHKNFLGGRADGYVAELDATTHKVFKLSYYGTSTYDQVYFIELDKDGNIYLAGQTEGNLPIFNATYGQPNRGQFITKLRRSMDTVIFNTTIGSRVGDPDFSPTAFLVDNCDNIYISGWGSDIAFDAVHGGSTNGLQVTPDAMQPATDGNDFYIAVLKPNATALLYATFFGGTTTEDHVDGGTSRFDKRGVIYQAICGSCPDGSRSFVSDINTTPGAVFPTNLSPRCSNTALKFDFEISYAVDAKFAVAPKLGCAPLTVNISDFSFNAKTYIYDFGDGTIDSSSATPTHTYTKPGKYKILLTIRNPSACNYSDTFSREVEVLTKTAPSFTVSQKDCDNYKVTFKNTSVNPLTYIWKFDDGTISTDANPVKIFSTTGTHKTTLIVNQGTLCEDSVEQTFTLKDYGTGEWKFPNVFTPGTDGYNDCYNFEGVLPECDEVKVEIYNRWGQLVFRSKDANACWDGVNQFSKLPVPTGVYYVVAELKRLKGDTLKYHGTVTLLR